MAVRFDHETGDLRHANAELRQQTFDEALAREAATAESSRPSIRRRSISSPCSKSFREKRTASATRRAGACSLRVVSVGRIRLPSTAKRNTPWWETDLSPNNVGRGDGASPAVAKERLLSDRSADLAIAYSNDGDAPFPAIAR